MLHAKLQAPSHPNNEQVPKLCKSYMKMSSKQNDSFQEQAATEGPVQSRTEVVARDILEVRRPLGTGAAETSDSLMVRKRAELNFWRHETSGRPGYKFTEENAKFSRL